MEILEVRFKDDETNYLHGKNVMRGEVQVLIDEFPKRKIFKRKGNYLISENDGLVTIYEHQHGTTDGFAGRTITLDIENEGSVTFKGSLWDPFSLPKDLHVYHVSITDSTDVWERGHTFYAGKILEGRLQPHLDKLGVVIKRRSCFI